MKTYLLHGAICIGLTLASALTQASDERVVVNGYTFPAALSTALQHGISLPVYLKYDQDNSELNTKSEQKIADAILIYKSNTLYIQTLDLNKNQQTTELTSKLKHRLEFLDQSFDDSMVVQVDADSSLKLDLASLYLELLVNRNALDTKFIKRTNLLEDSSSKDLSSILNYRFGYSHHEYHHKANTSNHLNIDSISSFKEHHFNINTSSYDLGKASIKTNLHRAMYERDFDGYRFAVGMMDTWSMQSIASLSALNTSKIYGVTYGNKSRTINHDKIQSLTPIVVFLPSAGTVQAYRDGKLLSIQNFSMGSHEIDTSNFPYGLYNIEIKTIIDGQENTTFAQVNKTHGRNSSVTGKLDWQVFGGALEYYKPTKLNYRTNVNEKDTWLMGLALAKSYDFLSGVDLRSTVYGFDENLVVEGYGAFSIRNHTNIALQTMLASDGSYLASTSLNHSLPKGYGAVHGGFNRSKAGHQLYFSENESFDTGLSLHLQQIHYKLGHLNTSYNKDLKNGYSHTNIEYSQNLFDKRYATINLRTGIQKYVYEYQQSDNDKYIFLDFKLPISRWFNAGISSRNSNLVGNVSYKQNISNSIIKNVGVDLNQVIKRENKYLDMDDFSASGYLSYQTHINSGSLSGGASAYSKNFNYTTQGSIASSNFDIGLGNNSMQNSGVLIKTGLPSDTTMSAVINGQDFTLKGNHNFISLVPYNKYNIEFRSSKQSMDTVSIGKGRKDTVVLYPGNVVKLEPEIKQMVTIFGRIRYPNGEVAANTQLNNHIGKTKTDQNGEFSLDVDKKYPTIILIKDNGDICESKLRLQDIQGVAWLGEISCVYKAASNSKNNLEARNHD